MPQLVSRTDPRNPLSEAYRSLRTNLTFARSGEPLRTLVITSAMPGEGKTTSATNLALTLAQQGARVLLVDADMRRGAMQALFEESREPGLSNILAGRCVPAAAIREVELTASHNGGCLDLLTTGTLPPNPAELLGSPRMRELVEQLSASYDLLVIDSPPLNLVTDAAILGSGVDGVVLVARAGTTASESVSYAMEQLRSVRANVLGTLLNGVDFARDARYAGYSGRQRYFDYYAYDGGGSG